LEYERAQEHRCPKFQIFSLKSFNLFASTEISPSPQEPYPLPLHILSINIRKLWYFLASKTIGVTHFDLPYVETFLLSANDGRNWQAQRHPPDASEPPKAQAATSSYPAPSSVPPSRLHHLLHRPEPSH